MSLHTKQVLFKQLPKGFPQESDFELSETDINKNVKDGEVLVKVLELSVDPYLRGKMAGKKTYTDPFELGKPLYSGGVGKVEASANDKLPVGSVVTGVLPWSEYALLPKEQADSMRKIDPSAGFPLSYYLGVLGMPAMTAYYGLLYIGEPKEGETVYVSAAAGAVGQIVGQIAKIKGCRVVGSVGSDDKVQLLKDKFKYDAAFNYKTDSDWDAKLKELCPDGIDVYFENVGGKMLEAVLNNCNKFARVPVCGMISQYNLEQPEGVHNLMQLIGKDLTMKGFIIGNHFQEIGQSFQKDMTQWLKEEKVQYAEDVASGLETAPKAFIRMLKGENIGKQVVHIADA